MNEIIGKGHKQFVDPELESEATVSPAVGAAVRAVDEKSAVVDVPDPRVDTLSALFKPEKTTYATVTFNDVSGFGAGRGSTDIGGALLNAIANNDALMLVVRAFEDENVPNSEKLFRIIAWLTGLF